jgi:hypothetical protein
MEKVILNKVLKSECFMYLYHKFKRNRSEKNYYNFLNYVMCILRKNNITHTITIALTDGHVIINTSKNNDYILFLQNRIGFSNEEDKFAEIHGKYSKNGIYSKKFGSTSTVRVNTTPSSQPTISSVNLIKSGNFDMYQINGNNLSILINPVVQYNSYIYTCTLVDNLYLQFTFPITDSGSYNMGLTSTNYPDIGGDNPFTIII